MTVNSTFNECDRKQHGKLFKCFSCHNCGMESENEPDTAMQDRADCSYGEVQVCQSCKSDDITFFSSDNCGLESEDQPDTAPVKPQPMDDEAMKEFLYSLAWASWSSYHNRNVIELLQKHFPSLDAKKQVSEFCKIVESPRGMGSPK